MTHDEIRESLPGYALHALVPEDARAVEAHLGTCNECRLELALFQDAAASLSSGFAEQVPPDTLRRRIMRTVRRGRPSGGFRPGWTVAMAAAAAIVVLAGVALSLEQRLTALRSNIGAEAQALTILADPASRVVTLNGPAMGSVRFVFDPATGKGALVATGLRDPGPDLVYQLWLVAGTTPQSAGVFRPAPGAPVVVPVGADFGRYQAVAVSVERGPNGAPRPSAAPILSGKLGGG
jgi:anti-sigma-K factor RskA